MLKRVTLYVARVVTTKARSSSVIPSQGCTRGFADSASSIHIHARAAPPASEVRLLQAVERAREAVAVAKEDDSDDAERDNSVAVSRHAIKLYDERVAALESAGNADARKEFDAQVGGKVALLKEELFASRKQRVWMMHSGWF